VQPSSYSVGAGVFFPWSKAVGACRLHGLHGENLTVYW
jgi:hypothetical protein